MPPDDRISRLLEQLTALAEEFRRIEADSGARREAAIAASGLPRDLVDRMLATGQAESGLTPNEPYETIESMSTPFVATPRKVGRPLSGGPVSRVAKKLGITIAALSVAIDVNENTLKTWNARKAIPADGQKKIDALLAKAKRDVK